MITPPYRRYVLLRGDVSTLEALVNEYLSNGWVLYGNPYAVIAQYSGGHYQAMVLPQDD